MHLENLRNPSECGKAEARLLALFYYVQVRYLKVPWNFRTVYSILSIS